ncbi:GtrA family protein [Aureimonas mangrovi]|uniref:GtrA family protein n=1 Tax=Aureimonas mangrovi TaxID=2758041 RepID=UPI00163DBB55|nr:GtrA family protein [Aureimonas mangrovi]
MKPDAYREIGAAVVWGRRRSCAADRASPAGSEPARSSPSAMHEPSLPSLRTRVLRFLTSGVLATLVHIAVASAMAVSGFNATASNSAAFVCANVVSYLANCLWTFEATVSARNAVRFACISLGLFTVILGVSLAVDAFGLHPFVAIALISVLVPALSFAAHNLWTFR